MTPTTDALAGLRDIHLPDPVAFWPPAPGWWLVLGILLAGLAAAAGIAWLRRGSLRRAAFAELAAVESDFRRQVDHAELAARVSALLRRVALARYPEDPVPSLHGPGWLRFLASTAGRPGFPAEVGERMATALWAGPSFEPTSGDAERWIATARIWIRSNT